jgi:uncharacterized membrane protein
MDSPHHQDHSSDKETGRLESFSDGVFSIAMTLLILELTVPGLNSDRDKWTSGQLFRALAQQWPHYLAFLTSFFTVLIMWVNHHGIFRMIRRTDSTLLLANGFLLMLVTFVPFPTDLVADYLRTPAASTACAVYSGTFVLISISYALVLLAARRNGGRLLAANTLPEVERRLRDCVYVGTPFYLAATLVAPWKPWLTIVICTVLWVFWALSRDGKGSGFGR